jgi:uncharacterized membrane protein YdjX (TVP38/TMEM64 family)
VASKLNPKIFFFVALALALVVAARVLPLGEWLDSFQIWAEEQGAFGMLVFALVYALAVVAFVPASILTLGAGAVYGLWTGTLVVLFGASLGAVVSFLLARTALRGRVEAWTEGNARFRALDGAVSREGGKIVFLVRLAPIFPFTYINYVFGLTGIPTLTYTLATVVGMIPGTLAYVYVGAAAATAATGDASATRTTIQILGAIAAVLVTIFVARLAAKAIRQAGVSKASSAGP